MKILTMTATFGCLDGVTLSLSDGVNLYALPNESGKSTWAAFVLAMFYGIDTSKRGSKGALPEKTRYQPWNGKSMSGTLELEHNGTIIVLQRTSQRSRPMSVFRAYDKTTGLELPELTAENCGQFFFGVEKSVFQRTAFLSGSELAVTEDQELARRLENLAVSGSMGDSYPAADARLKQWKNRCRYHQNGLIPETEARLLQAEGRLERLTALRQEVLSAATDYESCKTEAELLEQTERENWDRAKQAARNARMEAMMRLEQADGNRVDLPDSFLWELLEHVRYLEAHPLPPEPECPPTLQGISMEAIVPKAERDQEAYRQLRKKEKAAANLWLRLSGICGLLAVATAISRIWWAVALCLCGAAAGLVLSRVLAGKTGQQARELLQSYGVSDVDAILPAAKTRADWLVAQARLQSVLWQVEAKLERLQSVDESFHMENLTSERVEKLLAKSREGAEAKRAAELAEAGLVKADVPFSPSPELMKLRERTAWLEAQAQSLHRQEEDHGGLEKALYRREQLQQELNDLYLRENALELAREVMAAAHSQLEQVYAPRLTCLAGEYLQKLTNSRYDALIMGRDWQLQAREQDSGLARPLASLSSGAQDQVWLSLRLAMADLLLPTDAPLVLDDALLTFDDTRTEAALTLLRQTNRQILLFSCKE